MSRREQLNIGELTLVGTVSRKEYKSLIRDEYRRVLLCTGKTIPSGKSGFAIGCMFLHSTTGLIYTNLGNEMWSDFRTPSTDPVAGGTFTF
jgi:hypothetical protein